MFALYNIYLGYYDSITVWKTFYTLINSPNKEILPIYNRIILYNSLCLIVSGISLHLIIPTVSEPYILEMVFFFIWILPHYIITLLYNSIYTTELVKLYIEDQKYTTLKYKCYEKYSEYLVNKFYYQVVIVFLLVESMIVTQVPYVGKFIDAIFTSLVYSYYAWEYTWSQHKIPHRQRYDIFENKWCYYLGYALNIGIIKYFFSYFMSYHIISILFPFISLNTLNKYQNNDNIKESINLPIFKIPIYYTHFVINKLTKYLQIVK